MKLRLKLTLTFVMLGISPLLVVAWLAYDNGRNTIERHITRHLTSTNILKGSELHRWFRSEKRSIEELAQRPLVIEYAAVLNGHRNSEPEFFRAKRRLLDNHLKVRLQHGGFIELFVIGSDHGMILASTNDRQEGKIREKRPYFIEGKSRTHLQPIYYSTTIEQPTMNVSTPIRTERGRLIGVLVGRLDLGELSEIMRQGNRLRRSEDTYLVNNFNFFVTEPRFGRGYALKKAVHTEGVKACISGQSGVGYYNGYRGMPVIGAYQWLEDYNLALITEVDQSEGYAPIYRLARIIAAFTLAVVLTTGFLGFFFARSITKPMRQLWTGAEEIGRGNLEYRVGTAAKDEIGGLSRAFDRMARSLRHTIRQLKASNKELESFAYSVSHDLRAPLRAIDGYVNILEEDYQDRLDDEGRRVMGVIAGEAERMGHLIDGLLTYSRLGRTEMAPARIDMRTLADSVFHELTTEKDRERIDFRLDSVPPAIGDATLIRQVWGNLISNAIKYSSGRERAVIEVRGKYREEEIEYTVEDNGAGFDMQYADKLFGVFQRLHNSREFEGTGVGLANVHRAILRHGGRIWAYGEEDKGAAFYFTLPREEL